MASTAEINAAFDAVMPDLQELTKEYVPTMFGYQQKVLTALQADAHVRGLIVDGINRALVAAEHVRANQQPPTPKVNPSLKSFLKGP